MRACLVFEPGVWEIPEARFAIETVAGLMEFRWRSTVLGSPVEEREAPVYVGDPERAPADAAAIVAVTGWTRWTPADLEVATFDGAPLPCPGGELRPPASERELPAPWLRAIGFLLCREEELLDPRRDAWECFSGLYTRLHGLGILDRPLVNLYAGQLARRIEAWCERRHVGVVRLPRWKGGARFAAVLTHDVDDIRFYSLEGAWRLLRQARSPASYAFRAGLSMAARTLRRGSRPGDPYWNFERWVAEEDRRGFRSSFYFCPPRPSERHEYDPTYEMDDVLEFEGRRVTVGRLMGILAERGFEIGLHGSYRSHSSESELILQRAQIEGAAGGPVLGVRQHFLRFSIGDTWRAQEGAGFLYDSTLGYNEAIGFRAGIAAPFRPWDSSGRAAHRLTELPLTVMDGALFRTLELDGAQAARRVREHLDGVEAAGGLAVLLWHPNAAAEEQFPGWWDCYRETLEYLHERRAWVTTGAEMIAWWSARQARAAGSD